MSKCIFCKQEIGDLEESSLHQCKVLRGEVPYPYRDWKPVTGEKVLVEAAITHDKWHRDTVLVSIGSYMNIKVPISSIRPIRKEGE